MCWRSTSSICNTRAGAGRRIAPAWVLLPEDFDYSYLHHWRLENQTCYSTELDHISLPFEPHPGVVGVAPKEAGRFSTGPPRANGGNLDVRDMTIGSRIWIPVLVEGALFATGDCHAAQGQGEVCVTGIEAPMTVTMRITLRKNMSVQEVQLQRPSPMSKLDSHGYHVTTAHGPRFDDQCQERPALYDRLAGRQSAYEPQSGVYFVQCGRRLEDQRNRRRAQLGGVIPHAAGRFRRLVGADRVGAYG